MSNNNHKNNYPTFDKDCTCIGCNILKTLNITQNDFTKICQNLVQNYNEHIRQLKIMNKLKVLELSNNLLNANTLDEINHSLNQQFNLEEILNEINSKN